jgi:PleD family two-component response regulator
VSVGVTRADLSELSRHDGFSAALQRADRAMYAAKARGKNCVVVQELGVG